MDWKWPVVFMAAAFLVSLSAPSHDCNFPAIYNFGDSNSDTGSASALFFRLPPPNGMTYFAKPVGRYCDGRLIIDFIAEKLKLPFLSPYMDSIEGDFRHGANFAVGGSTAQPANLTIFKAGFGIFSLDIQILQFQQLKDRTNEIYNREEGSLNKGRIPRPEDFSKALYTLDIGQNDLHFALTTMSEKEVKESIPDIVHRYTLAIEKLYLEGARTFWIHNTGPIGCLPTFVLQHPQLEEIDEIGCIRSYNEVAQEFNTQLREKVNFLRSRLKEATLILIDIYSAKYSLISNAEKNGFVDRFGYCCGNLRVEPKVYCWSKKVVNGTEVFPSHCSDPLKYISWDGTHYTEAANRWVANRVMDG
ncbi:PREDICTED: GDSL esterase/lipase At5g14450-like [Tarenaya hassleriana]|uniref:GDSL esterase/lipase At5g14450-like n=1 Tax=Tarenaya hassleriana TaxID=28532 RepID=UPI0008FD28B7|nr:PREDICTED: GDSL esterase/lipase At5g14450-like [Tarenaya hassleriana]